MALGDKIFSILAIICMMVVAWLIGGYLWNLTSLGTITTTATWTLRIAIIITLLIGIFIVPIMVAIGRTEVHPMAGILGLGWMFTATILTYLLTGFVWNFNDWMFGTFNPNATLLFIIQFAIILLVIIFDFIAPALIMLGEDENNGMAKA